MSILYLITTVRPKIPEAEAVTQEITALRGHFGGRVLYINPNQDSPLYVPRLLFGFNKLKQIRALEASSQLLHLYNPDPFPFLFLRKLRRPTIYSVSCGVNDKRPQIAFFASLAAVTAPDQRSFERLKGWGLNNVMLVRPGIDLSRFTCSPLPPRSPIRLLVGSAPWSRVQFRTKGIDALLDAAQKSPQLHLVFLWRGVLAKEMARRVRRMNLGKQVQIINRRVDVNQVLSTVHASVTLATNPAIIKSYPHSLLDSLAAGKPVIVSRSIPMSDYVEQTGCGQVVEAVTPADILTAVETLAGRYDDIQRVAQDVGRRDFSQETMLASFRQVYQHVLKSGE